MFWYKDLWHNWLYLWSDGKGLAKWNTDNDSNTWKGKSLIRRVEGVGHNLYMDNFFSSLDLFDDLHIRPISCCGTVRQNHKGMLGYFDTKTINWNRATCMLGWEVSWQQWFGKTSVICAYWLRCTDHQQKATSVMNAGQHIILPLLTTKARKWTTLTNEREQLIAI
jgi:hypothetical protein